MINYAIFFLKKGQAEICRGQEIFQKFNDPSQFYKHITHSY